MTTPNYTIEQIQALAPDERALKAGKSQAVPGKWSDRGMNEAAVWGLCKGSGKDPYQTQIDLIGPAFRCTCPSRKFPCKHALGLFLLLATKRDQFDSAAPPSWAEEWIAKRRERAQSQESPGKNVADPKAAARRAAQREAKVDQGLDDLSAWMRDLIRQGLADAPSYPPEFWVNTAARLVDAQASGLARMVEELGSTVLVADWQEKFLDQLCFIHLLVNGYQEREHVAPELLADLRRLIGWNDSKEDLLAQPGLEDSWTVLGQSLSEVDVGNRQWKSTMRVQRIWLAGSGSRQAALVLHFAPPRQPLDFTFHVGTRFDGAVVFYPSAFPLRALVKEPRRPHTPAADLPAATSIRAATDGYGAALAAMPWTERVALPLAGVLPVDHDGAWHLQDEEGFALPLASGFAGGWELVALSGGAPMTCCGEWDGHEFAPLSVLSAGRWTDLMAGTIRDSKTDVDRIRER